MPDMQSGLATIQPSEILPQIDADLTSVSRGLAQSGTYAQSSVGWHIARQLLLLNRFLYSGGLAPQTGVTTANISEWQSQISGLQQSVATLSSMIQTLAGTLKPPISG
jgi:hypothetical protein